MTLDRERIVQALPAYEVGEEIGRGAWGIVLRGRHRQLDRPVAIKELPVAFGADPQVRNRFASEARLLATLDHPHIVPIFDYVESDGLCVLVMELLPGGTVWDRFTGRGVAAAEALSIAIATCSALDHAHRKGILHRDIKPENLLFAEAGTLKVSDFGIAKVMGGAESMATRTGLVLGTPAYMAPEQALGSELSPATDVYAVGSVLYELLCGRLPFPDEGNAIALLYRHAHEEPVPLDEVRADLPGPLVEVVMRAISRSPDDRYPSAERLGVALADAATTAWGRGWARQGGVAIMATGEIAERLSGPAGVATTAVSPPPSRLTMREPAPATVIEPITERHEQAGPVEEPSPDELVPLQAIVETELAPPPAPPPMAAPPPAPPPEPPPTPPPPAAPPPPADGPPGAAGPTPRTPPRRGRRGLLVALLAGFAVVVLVVVVVVVTRGGGSGPTTSATTASSTATGGGGPPAVAATVTVGPGADHVATGAGGVWVTDGAARTVARIDPAAATASTVATLEQAPHSIAAGDDGLWVTSPSATAVVHIRPGADAASTQRTSIGLAKAPTEIAWGEGGAWVTTGAGLVRIDSSDQVVATVPVGDSPDSVAAGEGAVWVANRLAAGTVTRVDPSSNKVVATIAVGGLPDQIAVGEGSVWVANAADGTVSRIDPATNQVTATVPVGAAPESSAVGDGAVWVVNTKDGTVSKIVYTAAG